MALIYRRLNAEKKIDPEIKKMFKPDPYYDENLRNYVIEALGRENDKELSRYSIKTEICLLIPTDYKIKTIRLVEKSKIFHHLTLFSLPTK